jgi:hypothetical protein
LLGRYCWWCWYWNEIQNLSMLSSFYLFIFHTVGDCTANHLHIVTRVDFFWTKISSQNFEWFTRYVLYFIPWFFKY